MEFHYLTSKTDCSSLSCIIPNSADKGMVVKHGYIRKRGGILGFTYQTRFLMLFRTSQGHFLAYYNKEEDCPFYHKTSQLDKNIIDMASVTGIDAPSKVQGDKADPLSFDISTAQRKYTFVAQNGADLMAWLKAFDQCFATDALIIPDAPVRFFAHVGLI